MESKVLINKKYGIWTATAMVIGIVIGSGVFFKADNVLLASNGSISMALLAWIVGAISMIFGALVFADCSSKYETSNGVVDYAEVMVSKKYAHLIGWFNAILYYPALAAVLAWVSANYTCLLFGFTGNAVWWIALIYVFLIFVLNHFAPILSGKFQVSTTVIKLIPLLLIAVVGIVSGLFNGVLLENFVSVASDFSEQSNGFAAAVLATAFAYEGWIIATTINSEIKDSKKNLPKALAIGSIFVFVIYILYFLGIVSVIPAETVLAQGDNAVNLVAKSLFGQAGATILTIFVIISCLGTLNGLVLGSSRGFYSLAVRDQGIAPQHFKVIDSKTNMPKNSSFLSLFFILVYLFVWFANFKGLMPNGLFIDISELPIAMIYGLYISIYISYMRKMKNEPFYKRFLFPILALLGATIVVYGALSKPSVLIDLSISIVVFISGLFFYKKETV